MEKYKYKDSKDNIVAVKCGICLASFKTLATFELKHNFCVVKYNHNLH